VVSALKLAVAHLETGSAEPVIDHGAFREAIKERVAGQAGSGAEISLGRQRDFDCCKKRLLSNQHMPGFRRAVKLGYGDADLPLDDGAVVGS